MKNVKRKGILSLIISICIGLVSICSLLLLNDSHNDNTYESQQLEKVNSFIGSPNYTKDYGIYFEQSSTNLVADTPMLLDVYVYVKQGMGYADIIAFTLKSNYQLNNPSITPYEDGDPSKNYFYSTYISELGEEQGFWYYDVMIAIDVDKTADGKGTLRGKTGTITYTVASSDVASGPLELSIDNDAVPIEEMIRVVNQVYGYDQIDCFAATATYTAGGSSQDNTSNKITNISVLTSSTGNKIDNFVFSEGQTTYSLNVENIVSSCYILVTTESGSAVVTGDGQKTLNEGSNPFVVYATSGNGTKGAEYTITITRAANTAVDDDNFDPSVITTNYGIYFNSTKTLILDSPNTFDVYVYVKQGMGYADIIAFTLKSNYQLNSPSITPYENGDPSKNYFYSTYIEELGQEEGFWYYDVMIAIDVDKTADGKGTLRGKTGTITYTVNSSEVTSPLQLTIDNDAVPIEEMVRVVNDVYGYDNIDCTGASLTIQASTGSSATTLSSIKLDNTNVPFSSATINYTMPSYESKNTTLDVSTSDGATISTISYGSNVYTHNSASASQTITLGNPGTTTTVSIVVKSSDNTATQTYTLNIARPMSSDTSATIVVKGKKDNITYTKDATSTDSIYVYNIPESASRAEVTITATGYGATVTTGTTASFNIPSTGNTVTIQAQDGTTKNIIINITKAKDTNNKINDIKVQTSSTNTTLIHNIGFSQSTTSYSFTVGNSVTSVYFNVTKASNFAQVTGDGTQVLNVGQNTFKIYATSESGVKGTEYTITITREASVSYNFEISSITLIGNDGVNYLTNYNKDTKAYTITVPNSVSTVTVNATVPAGSNTTVIGNSGYSLTAGSERTIVVQSVANGDATQKGEEYVIKVTRQQALTNNQLTNLTVDGVQVENFSPTQYNYTMRVDLSVSSVNIGATIDESTKAEIVSGLGSKTLNEGRNEAKVVVRAQSGLTQDYVITIYRQEDKNTISNIAISGFSGIGSVYTFSSSDTSYTFNVPYSVSSLNFAVSYDGSRGIITGAGNKSLSLGLNTHKVYVTSQYGTKGTEYTFNITRQQGDTNNNLVSLSVLAGGITELLVGDKAFSANTTTYTLQLESSVSTLNIIAVAESENATVTGNVGNVDLTPLFNALPGGVGVVPLKVYVTPEQGSTKTYTIMVSRQAINEDEDNSVTGIKITNDKAKTIFESEFNQSQTTYSFTVPYDINSVNVIVSRGSSKSTLYGDGTFTFDSTNELNLDIYCVSQSGVEGTHYTFNITRELPDTENRLNSLKFMGELVTGFNSDKISYTKNVEYTDETVYIEASPKSSNATINIVTSSGLNISNNQNFNLSVGNNIITISVTSQSNETKIYTLTIVRPEAPGQLNNLKVESAVEGMSGNYALLNADGEMVVFDKDVYTYYVKVSFEIDNAAKLNIITEYDQSKLDVDIFGDTKNFVIDEPVTIMIFVKPTDNTSGATNSVYYLIITREQKATDVIKISNVDINNAIDFDPDTFDPNKTEYDGTVYVKSNISSIDFDITFDYGQDEKAPTYKVIGGNSLKFGNNIVCLEICSSSKNNKMLYYFNVVRKDAELTNARITQISDFSIKFSNDINTYCYTVDNNVDKLDIKFDTDCENTTYRLSTTKLETGLNNINVDVYSGEEKVKTFNLIVLRQESKDSSLSQSTIIIIVVIAIVVIIEVAIVITILHTIKKAKNSNLAKNDLLILDKDDIDKINKKNMKGESEADNTDNKNNKDNKDKHDKK